VQEFNADPLVLTANGYAVSCDDVIVATHNPLMGLEGLTTATLFQTKLALYTSYVVAARVPKGSVPDALWWDTDDPYKYMRLEPGATHDLVIFGGEDHKTGQATDMGNRYRRLEKWMRERFPAAGKVDYEWSGQVLEPVDGLAYIGPNPLDKASVFIATGFSGTGMTYGTISGMLLTDLIQGRENAWAKTYDPSRVTVGAAKEFVEENLNVAAQYADLVTGGEVESTGNIKRGTGAILRRGLTKVAVYRDDEGVLHERSAICPHLGCVVDWNPGEKTWDCPCHGSRYHRDGHVINGPANGGLADVEE
jgi:Rieske Fe-S protein